MKDYMKIKRLKPENTFSINRNIKENTISITWKRDQSMINDLQNSIKLFNFNKEQDIMKTLMRLSDNKCARMTIDTISI